MPSRRTRKRWRASCLLAAAVTLLLATGAALDVLATVRAQALDLLFVTRPARAAQSTVIVGIDQRSYQALLPRYGPLSAWPRSLYARALDALGVAGPRVVAFAVFFDAPRAEDGELTAAMRRAGNVVVPAVAQRPLGFSARPGVAQEFDTFVRPVPAIRAAAAAEGAANITTARDSVVRGLPLLLRAERGAAAQLRAHGGGAPRAPTRGAGCRAGARHRLRERGAPSRSPSAISC